MGNCLTSSAPNFSSQKLSSTPGTSSNNRRNVGSSGNTSSTAAGVSHSFAYPNGRILDQPNLKEFSFAELKSVSKNFGPESLIGQGRLGKVYKGWLDEKSLAPPKNSTGLMDAIRKPNTEIVQGFQEWQEEVNFFGRLNHPNLVRLLGFCWEDEELLLIYEFLPNGSLENHLFEKCSSIEPFSWESRIKIVVGAARGLAFLHSSGKKVLYRDFKASNILLDSNYNAKISDFGLAKLGPAVDESFVTTLIKGTSIYMAPEYINGGRLYAKSDVYGFGVVLLQIMTGLRAFDTTRRMEERNLVDWVKKKKIKNLMDTRLKIKNLMDTRLEGRYSLKAAVLVGNLTLKCVETDPRKRPSMQEVLEALEQIEKLKDKPKETKISNSQSKQLHQRQPNNSSAKRS